MLLICLAPMPYGYYQIVRFVAMTGFTFLAYCHFKSDEGGLSYTFAILALLFQPFFKIALGRNIQNVVDVLVATGLIILLFMSRTKQKT